MKKSKLVPQKWTISRSVAANLGWHIQARTADQCTSMAVVPGPTPAGMLNIHRNKAPNGFDVFVLTVGMVVTMNIAGEITYVGDWKDVPITGS